MKWRTRFLVAWHALRGWAIISGVKVSYGEIQVHGNLYNAPESEINSCHIFTEGRAILISKRENATNNEGYLATVPTMREARQIRRAQQRRIS